MGDDDKPEQVTGELVPAAESSPRSARPGEPGAGTPWPKGVSGNPGGRPAELAALQQSIRSRHPELIARLFKIALEGNPGNPTTVRACEILLERGFGKAPITVVDENGNQMRVGIIILPSERGDDE